MRMKFKDQPPFWILIIHMVVQNYHSFSNTYSLRVRCSYPEFSAPYFPVFWLNMNIDSANHRIKSEWVEMQTSKNCEYRHVFCSGYCFLLLLLFSFHYTQLTTRDLLFSALSKNWWDFTINLLIKCFCISFNLKLKWIVPSLTPLPSCGEFGKGFHFLVALCCFLHYANLLDYKI